MDIMKNSEENIIKKFYRIWQSKWDNNDRLIIPEIPVTDKNISIMLKSGIAEEITEEESKRAKWGSGNFTKIDGEYKCICYNWDTSG